jgi:Na+/melibiose symporter-like transporter
VREVVGEADLNPDRQVVKRRLMTVVVGSFLMGLALSGTTVILPLYVTRNLGVSKAGYARVQSMRMIFATVGVILIGALSDRFGNKRLSIASLVLGGVAFGVMGFVPLVGFLILIPFAGAFLSSSYVNLNYLTQMVDPQRQGRANTLYRSSGTLAGMVAPILVTRWLSTAQWVFAGLGASLCLGAVIVREYPLAEPAQAFTGWSRELRSFVDQYRRAWAQRHLMRFIHISLLMWVGFASVGTFFAIRLTDELGAADRWYGAVCSTGSAVSLVGIIALGAVLDRVCLKRCFVIMAGLAILSVVVMGLTSSKVLTAHCFILYSVLIAALAGPTSMWISREAGSVGMGSAFSVHKVLSAAYGAAGVFVLSLIEPAMGISRVFLVSGIFSALLLVALVFLRTPPAALSVTVGARHSE